MTEESIKFHTVFLSHSFCVLYIFQTSCLGLPLILANWTKRAKPDLEGLHCTKTSPKSAWQRLLPSPPISPNHTTMSPVLQQTFTISLNYYSNSLSLALQGPPQLLYCHQTFCSGTPAGRLTAHPACKNHQLWTPTAAVTVSGSSSTAIFSLPALNLETAGASNSSSYNPNTNWSATTRCSFPLNNFYTLQSPSPTLITNLDCPSV